MEEFKDFKLYCGEVIQVLEIESPLDLEKGKLYLIEDAPDGSMMRQTIGFFTNSKRNPKIQDWKNDIYSSDFYFKVVWCDYSGSNQEQRFTLQKNSITKRSLYNMNLEYINLINENNDFINQIFKEAEEDKENKRIYRNTKIRLKKEKEKYNEEHKSETLKKLELLKGEK